MEGISLGIVDEGRVRTDNIFAVVVFKKDDMTGYWPYISEKNNTNYYLAEGIPTLTKETLLSGKCLIKW